MEVHHHAHHDHGKKNWKSYFWEFLMLFLAVFCGFLAEYQLEHKIEKDKEKQFMQSMLKDLAKDTVSLNKAISGNTALLKGIDTLLTLIAAPLKENSANEELYLYSLKYTYWYFKPQFSELTLSQLKNSGGYRLIKNNKVAEGIADYALGVEACRNQEASVFQYFHVYENTQKDIINMVPAKNVYTWFEIDIMNMLRPMQEIKEHLLPGNYFLPGAERHLSRYYSDILFFSTSLKNFSSFLRTQKAKTVVLDQLIRDNYKLID